MPFAIGENIGPYRVMEQLGQGGMATVYKAYHAALDRYVALKVLHPAFGEDPNFEARFQREARLVAKLDHPNIVPVYDYSEHDKRPFLVMKFIEGETLKARMARGPLASDELAKIIEAVGAALGYAHKTGILHRDIKPSNVLLTTDGSIYLADFGLARIASMGESTLSGDMIMGTPQYISPEQAMGKKELDEGTDIYSFGVMLYEMVVGQVPFNADTPFSIIHDHIYTPLPIPHNINPSVPEPVERVLLKALSKERADRYSSVTEMVTAFKQAWQSAGVPMKGTTITMPPRVMPAARPAVGTTSKKSALPTAETSAAVESIPKKRRSPWMMVAAGVLLVICCMFAFVTIRAMRLQGNFFSGGPSPTPLPTQVVAIPTNVPPTEPILMPSPPTFTNVPPPATVPPQATIPPAVLVALQAVQQNPNDAQANLQLSLVYWDAGQYRISYVTLQTAANLAGQDAGFFIDAAHQFAVRQAWVSTSAMYFRAINLQPPGAPVPPELETAFHEAVYKAAANPDLPAYLTFEKIATFDESLALVAQGRNALHSGNLPKAKEFLNRVKRLNPDLFEARLLEAEIQIKDGKNSDAKNILTGLNADLDTPQWIRQMAEEFFLQIP